MKGTPDEPRRSEHHPDHHHLDRRRLDPVRGGRHRRPDMVIPTLIQRYQVQEAIQALMLDPEVCVEVILRAPDQVLVKYYRTDENGQKYLDEHTNDIATAEVSIPVVD